MTSSIFENIYNQFNPPKTLGDYIIKKTIGKGTFSTVKLGEHIKTKQKVAIKILNKDKIKAQEDSIRIKREIKILSMMDHPNIIKTYKITENVKNYQDKRKKIAKKGFPVYIIRLSIYTHITFFFLNSGAFP